MPPEKVLMKGQMLVPVAPDMYVYSCGHTVRRVPAAAHHAHVHASLSYNTVNHLLSSVVRKMRRRVHGTCTTTHRRSTFGILSLDARWCRGRHEAAAGPGAPWTLHHSFSPCCAAATRGHHHVRRWAGIHMNRSARPAVHYSAQTQTTASFNSDLCAGACTVGPGSL